MMTNSIAKQALNLNWTLTGAVVATETLKTEALLEYEILSLCETQLTECATRIKQMRI